MSKEISFAALLQEAVSKPGFIGNAFKMFHRYSIRNQLLALSQCAARGIVPGPLSTFKAWKAKKRFVRKGERAITLCYPVMRAIKETLADGTEKTFSRLVGFNFANAWFVLSQTDGADITVETPENVWDFDKALAALDIKVVPFKLTDGNCHGYATFNREIAINPVAPNQTMVAFHELAHQVLGHCKRGTQTDSDATPRNLQEVEAESVAFILANLAGITQGLEVSRGYIQTWLGAGNEIPEKSASVIFGAVEKIWKAGGAVTEGGENEK